jgi:uncharacterized protein (TIGR02271 family)
VWSRRACPKSRQVGALINAREADSVGRALFSGPDRKPVIENEPESTEEGVITRSEQQLLVDVEQVESSRIRLRKYVVTEQVTLTFDVSHEELRIEREASEVTPMGSGSLDQELHGEEIEITLHAQRLMITKETVPIEQIRIVKEAVTTEETITEDLRKEQLVYEEEEIT